MSTANRAKNNKMTSIYIRFLIIIGIVWPLVVSRLSFFARSFSLSSIFLYFLLFLLCCGVRNVWLTQDTLVLTNSIAWRMIENLSKDNDQTRHWRKKMCANWDATTPCRRSAQWRQRKQAVCSWRIDEVFGR